MFDLITLINYAICILLHELNLNDKLHLNMRKVRKYI